VASPLAPESRFLLTPACRSDKMPLLVAARTIWPLAPRAAARIDHGRRHDSIDCQTTKDGFPSIAQ